MLKRKKYIAANWKMNGSLQQNQALLESLIADFDQTQSADGVDVAIFSPFPYLFQLRQALEATCWQWGGQDLSLHASGAYTGEVSGAMLRDFGAKAVIVGHSERRAMHHETSQLVAQKAKQAIACGLMPIVCVGETLQERDVNQTFDVLVSQLDPVLEALGAQADSQAGGSSSPWPAILAYEPVWAIGTGKTATVEQASEVHAFLRDRLRVMLGQAMSDQVRILYGGSVKASNAYDLLHADHIDGALVGGASLQAPEFAGIIRAALR